VDALALGADEGRDEHRYASGSCKQALIRRFPNGETHHSAVWHRNPASGSSRIASSAYQKWPTWSSRFPADSAKPVPLAVVSLDSRQGQWESR